MKPHFLIPILVLFACFSCKNTTPIEPIEKAPKAILDFPDPQKGTQLSYSIVEKGQDIPIKFIIQQYDEEIDFLYHVSNQFQKEGGFHLSKEMLKSARSTLYDFVNINTIEMDQIGLLLSKDSYSNLFENGKMEVNLGKGTKEYVFVQNEELQIKSNNKPIYISTIKFTDVNKTETFWVYKHLNFPLLVRIDSETSLILKDWDNPMEES